ncbi:MAG: hypothetical protein ACKOXI_00685 [Candidatus Planktophila sp.]
MAVIASFLIGRNGASTLGGISSPLSTPADRARFLARHRSAGAFIIGKKSAAIESYENSAQPVFVFTRTREKLEFPHPSMQQITVRDDLSEITRLLDQRIEGDIVVEAGAELLLAMLKTGAISQLELTISPIDGDGHFVSEEELLQHFNSVEEVNIEGTRLLKCRNEGDSPNS